MREYHLGVPIGAPDLVEPNILYTGKVSWFGGPKDMGVTPSEGLALLEWSDVNDKAFSWLFLKDRTKGLARSLNPNTHYCAMRWDYTSTPKRVLREEGVVELSCGGKTIWCTPVDWGPNENTGRLIDVSPGALFQLGIGTDAIVTARLVIGRRAFALES